MATKYLNPYTDFGFKKLFGEEASKDLLVDFLNQLLPFGRGGAFPFKAGFMKNPPPPNFTQKKAQTRRFGLFTLSDVKP